MLIKMLLVPFEIGELAYQIFDLAELASKKVIKILLPMVSLRLLMQGRR